MENKLLILLNLLALMSQIPIRAQGVILNAAFLTANGYTTASTVISLDYKNIDIIDANAFTGYTKAIHISLNYNRLTEVDFGAFSACSNLSSLQISSNPINKLFNSNNAVFIYFDDLSLMNTRFNEFDMDLINKSFPNLSTMYLTSYELEELKPNMLDVFRNDLNFWKLFMKVRNQEMLEYFHFYGIAQSVRSITFESSKIQRLESETFFKLEHLSILVLSDNYIETVDNLVFPNSLESLSLKKNRLRSFKPIVRREVTNIITLHLEENQFTTFETIDFSLMPKLKNLYLGSNPITEPNQIFSQIGGGDNIKYILLDNLGISVLESIESLKGLEDIFLNNNAIEKIFENTFTGLTNITTIILDNNRLENINDIFVGLNKLKVISLNNNKISEISPTAFSNLPRLETVRLSYNLLTSLPVNMFAGCTSLRYIYLYGNSIPTATIQSLCPTSQCQVYH